MRLNGSRCARIVDLIINTRAGTKQAARRGRSVRQLGLKCPLMNFFGTCLLATHFITSWCSWTRCSVIYPPSSSPSTPSLCGGWREDRAHPTFPRPCLHLFRFVQLMKTANAALGPGTLLAGRSRR